MKFKNYIFDMDGTIWDAAEMAAKGFTAGIRVSGKSDRIVTVEDIHKNFGLTLEQVAVNLLPELSEKEAMEVILECEKHQSAAMEGHVQEIVFPQVVDTLQKLKERGCGLYIVSNCLDGYLDILYRNMDVKKYIDGDAWLHHPMHCKADNIRYVVDEYQLTDACYVGDIRGDYDASMEAGVEFVFAAYGYGDVPEAKYIINQFSDLCK
ncbi:MAG: HAD family hydrolase [Anaerovibrio sp.]